MLKAYFDSDDHKFLFKMRDEFTQDMQINFVSGIVTRTTDKFMNVYQNDYNHKRFKQTDFMKELAKDPQSRDSDKLGEIVDLFKNLRFLNQFDMLKQSDLKEFAQTVKLIKFK